MKSLSLFSILVVMVASVTDGQNRNPDSATYILENTQADTNSIKHLLKFSNEIAFSNSDISLLLDAKALNRE